MTNSRSPLSPNSAVEGIPASPAPKWSSFRPIESPTSPVSPSVPYAPHAFAPPLSPASPHSTASPPWSPATTTSTTSTPQREPDSPPQGPRRYREDDTSVQDLFIDRSFTEHRRLNGAKNRSLALLDTYAESGSKYMPDTPAPSAGNMDLGPGQELAHQKEEDAKQEYTWSYNEEDAVKDGNAQPGFVDRSLTEEVRLHDAKQRSLALLQTYTVGTTKPGTEADKTYREKLKSIPREDEIYDNQKTRQRKNKHLMATSTRKKKSENAEKRLDAETEEWHSMKNQIDLDREKAAEKKALLLLDIMAMF